MKKITALRSLFLILLLTLSALPVLSYTITVMVKPGWTETLYKYVETEECEFDNDWNPIYCNTMSTKYRLEPRPEISRELSTRPPPAHLSIGR